VDSAITRQRLSESALAAAGSREYQTCH
jgi:hypothetical protein